MFRDDLAEELTPNQEGKRRWENILTEGGRSRLQDGKFARGVGRGALPGSANGVITVLSTQRAPWKGILEAIFHTATSEGPRC